MKISNSKKQLAKIIHENGGWRDGAEFTAQDGDGTGSIDFFKSKPKYCKHDYFWRGVYDPSERIARTDVTIKNWHKTILSREEYFHLYPVAEAALETVAETKLTIEQLAADYRNAKDYADRKQRWADAAKADTEAKLKALELAGEAIGLSVSPITGKKEPELVITDWRDLLVGDEIRCTEGTWCSRFIGRIGVVKWVEDPSYQGDMPLMVEVDGESDWGDDFEFIRRP